jgi:DNA primase
MVKTRIDWKEVRDTIDLAEVATRLLGPAPGRRGERGRRLWWPCPLGTHEDRNPSFCVEPSKAWWRCYGCGARGDAVALVRGLNPSMTFPEAVAFLTGGPAPTRPSILKTLGTLETPTKPRGISEADALALVADAQRRLWTAEGADALASLHGRGLTDETIRAARLGLTPPLDLPGRPRGIVVPWRDGDRLTLVKLRQPEGVKPKYREVFRDPDRPPGLYPGRHVIQVGRPLVIPEGEFDALLLGQELGELAAVVTLGSASARPDAGMLGAMLAAAPWYIATDGDAAGEKAAAGWPARARRKRPPAPFKDWTEAHQAGVNLRRWWSDVLTGNERPPRFSWDELAALRWGPATDDPTPGIIVDRPDPARRQAAIEAADPFDAYALAERVAIQEEN